jgi:predicted DNA-binding transcriptional regulator AlpA
MAETKSVNERTLLLKAEEVARTLAISTRTLWRLVSTDGFPQPVKLGGSTRWRAAEVLAWVEHGCTHETNDQE